MSTENINQSQEDVQGVQYVLATGNTHRYFQNVEHVLPDYDPVKNVISISEWIHKIESYAELYDWDDIAIRHYGLSKLTGVAKTWRDSITKQPECWAGWADWCELLRENFAFEDDCLTLRLAAQNYK
ncbi:hypothetical protein QE152_g35042 [Popillia japonica]|uniref:Retrotransposon gag domain-containing protein n=1 Tax=Popillia japonica TaxID=7064 RepID=A0AAW1IRS2_POPJA